MPRQGLGHSSVDIYNMVTPGTDDGRLSANKK